MAEVVEDIIKTINETNVEVTESIEIKSPDTTEGMLIAYTGLAVMALVPIFLGSFRSVKLQVRNKIKKEVPESMTEKGAMLFPVIASGVLLSFNLLLRIFSKEYFNLLMIPCFYIFGVTTLCSLIGKHFSAMLPKIIPLKWYQLQLTEIDGEKKLNWINVKFTSREAICFTFCEILVALHLYTKHWITNNIFGLAFAVYDIEFFHLNNIKIGYILLCGLFVYDILWVLGTNVMDTVAKSLDAPIRLIFPRDLLENGILASKSFSMLGLGDIVVPGIFIAFLLRFDQSLNRKTNLYFNATCLTYFLGLLTTVFVMQQAAQPALLYLVPACLITPILVALVAGDLKALFSYEDHDMKLKNFIV